MFCKITRNQVSPEDLGRLTRVMKEQWYPLASRQEGFKGAYFMTKPDGELVSIVLWETEAQAYAWGDNPEHKQISNQVASLFTAIAAQDLYEVQDIS